MTFVTTDIDECNVGKICGKHICVNKVGSYHCLCIKGYHKAEGVCVPNSPAFPPSGQRTSQSSLTIYLAVGEYIYCMSISYDYVIAGNAIPN